MTSPLSRRVLSPTFIPTASSGLTSFTLMKKFSALASSNSANSSSFVSFHFSPSGCFPERAMMVPSFLHSNSIVGIVPGSFGLEEGSKSPTVKVPALDEMALWGIRKFGASEPVPFEFLENLKVEEVGRRYLLAAVRRT